MNNEIKVLYQFADFRLDPFQKCLWRGGDLVSLTPKAIETLLVLVRHKGAVVEKDKLLDEVWADTFVEEATLAQNISTLRKVLGSQPDRQFIETIPRRGYRFVASIKEVVADEEIYIVEKHRRMSLVATQEIHNSDPQDSPASNLSDRPVVANGHQPASGTNPAEAKPLLTAAAQTRSFVFTKNKFLAGAAVACLITVLVGVWAASQSWLQSPAFAESKFQKPRFTKLTSDNNIARAVLSPDGKYLALVIRKGGSWSLQLRQINNAGTIEIISPSTNQLGGVTFSHDSQTIYYTLYPKAEQAGGLRTAVLYKIPLLGGVPEQLLSDIDSHIAISPDSREFVFVRQNPKENRSMLIVAGFDGRAERQIASRPLKNSFSLAGPSWSPDGKTIVCTVNNNGDSKSSMDLLAVDAVTGEQRSFLSQQFQWIGQNAWLKDGSGVVFPAFSSDSQNLTDEIWLASFPEGKIRSITNGITGFNGISISSDARAFVTINSSRSSNFWLQPIAPSGGEGQRVTQTSSEYSLAQQSMSWAPDRKIVFDTTRNGNPDLWMIDSDGSGQKQLTVSPAADYAPELSPDGKFVIFLSNRSGVSNLWRMNLDGTGIRQLTSSNINLNAGVSTDGKFAYYSQRIGENVTPFLWKVSLEGGEPVQLTDKATHFPQVSPDGKLIACFYADGATQFGTKLSILSTENGSLVRQFDVPSQGALSRMSWSQDGRKIYFLKNQDGLSTIFEQSLDAAPPVKVIESKSDTIFRFALSPDNRTIFYENGGYIRDVVLVESVE